MKTFSLLLCALLITGCSALTEWPKAENPPPGAIEYWLISRVTGDAMSTGRRWSFRQAQGFLGDPVAIQTEGEETRCVWPTDHPDVPHFVGLFRGGLLWGFDTSLDDYPRLKLAVTENMFKVCSPNGFNPMSYEKQVGGGDL